MKDKKLGFIGCGNMASAMMGGIIKKHIIEASDIIASDVMRSNLEHAKNTMNINITEDNIEVVKQSKIVVLSIKPQYYEEAIYQIKESIQKDQIIVTIAPGKTLDWLAKHLGEQVKIVRTMPNTPALVGEGMTGVCHNKLVTKEELEYICEMLEGFGKVEVVNENLIDAVVSVSGSAPAYVFMFIEAMADAAVAEGMPRQQAYRFASQAILGSAKMVLETRKHPAELKDMVCSPGGTTIEAVRVLEEKGLRSAVMEAMKACTSKAKGL